jgi:ABC-type enterochelin transport system ATPase subunit
MTPPTYPDLPETCLVVLIGASGAGKSTLAATWPASQVLSLDAMREAVSDDFSPKLDVLRRPGCVNSKISVRGQAGSG